MPSDRPDTTQIVRDLLAEAGIAADEDEIEYFIAAYAEQQEISNLLFAVEEARYESPGLSFTAVPTFADWWTDDHQ
jgi:hypothetical protein